jgi:two-component system phosphate regulon response regulator OmpR
MPDRILIIDDDTALSAMLAEYLGSAGLEVRTRATAKDGLAELAAHGADALVLDVMLPDADGLEVCRRLRAEGDVPIVMLTARGEDTDRIVGLELGADDYVAKPFNPRELLARLRAVLRRRARRGSEEVLRFGRLEVDRDARVARVDGEA